MGIISIKKYSGDRKLKEMFLILIKSPQTPLHFLSSEYILREILSHLDSRTGQISKIWKSSGRRNICLTQLLYFSLFCCFPWCSIESLCNLNNLISHLTSESELSTGMISEAFSKLNDSVIYCFLGSPSAVEGTWCGQGLVCLEAAAGSTFVAPALLFPSLWTESLWKPGHRQQISLAEVKFPQQTTGGSARLPQIEPKKGFFPHFTLQFSVGFIVPKHCCLYQNWIFGCFCFSAVGNGKIETSTVTEVFHLQPWEKLRLM